MDLALEKLVGTLEAAGGEVYEVGGSIRDGLLNRQVHDRDILVRLLGPKEILAALLAAGFKTDEVGVAFSVIKATVESETFDIALPRRERSTGPLHSDFEIISDSQLPVEEDLARRDFTINAMARRLSLSGIGEIIDPFGGQADLKRGIVRTVGFAHERFREDPLRMLRAIRFANRLGFLLATGVPNEIEHLSKLLTYVSKERVFEELSRILNEPINPGSMKNALKTMRDYGVFSVLLPEFAPSVGFDQLNPYHHLTIDHHVFMAVCSTVEQGASLRVRWAALLHDIAKPTTFTVDTDGCGHFYGHEDKSAAMAETILHRLRAPSDFTADVCKLIANHLRPQHDIGTKGLRRWIADMGPLTDDAIELRQADLAAHKMGPIMAWHWAQDLREKLSASNMREVQGFRAGDLALDGNSIMNIFGVRGKEVGRLKHLATNAVIDGLVPNDAAQIEAFLRQEISREVP